jgi:hypothetical protein
VRTQIGVAAPGVLDEQGDDVRIEPIELHRSIPADPPGRMGP